MIIVDESISIIAKTCLKNINSDNNTMPTTILVTGSRQERMEV